MTPNNTEIARQLEELADLLEAQDADPFRVRSYRRAAQALLETESPAADLVAAGGLRALQALPGIGKSLAGLIAEIVETGESSLLRRLEGQVSGEPLFATLPGVGPELARRIHDELGIQTLEELELAAHDGRLDQLPGFGMRRVRMLKDELDARLRYRTLRRTSFGVGQQPPADPLVLRPGVEVLLEVDQEYRSRSDEGALKRIAPRRFNPSGDAWLPILHTERDGWAFTALYSNTARAHELNKVHDWVVLFCDRDGDQLQCTVVTETRGPLAGKRVVRGREAECKA